MILRFMPNTSCKPSQAASLYDLVNLRTTRMRTLRGVCESGETGTARQTAGQFAWAASRAASTGRSFFPRSL